MIFPYMHYVYVSLSSYMALYTLLRTFHTRDTQALLLRLKFMSDIYSYF